MSTLTLPQRNGSQAHAPREVWLRLSVQDFFRQVNWDNTSAEIQAIQQTAAVARTVGSMAPLGLTLTVSQFMAAVNWEDTAIAAAVSTSPSTLPTPPAVNDLTLEDFSSLF